MIRHYVLVTSDFPSDIEMRNAAVRVSSARKPCILLHLVCSMFLAAVFITLAMGMFDITKSSIWSKTSSNDLSDPNFDDGLTCGFYVRLCNRRRFCELQSSPDRLNCKLSEHLPCSFIFSVIMPIITYLIITTTTFFNYCVNALNIAAIEILALFAAIRKCLASVVSIWVLNLTRKDCPWISKWRQRLAKFAWIATKLS